MGESGDWKSTPVGAATGTAPALNGPILKGMAGIETLRGPLVVVLRGMEGDEDKAEDGEVSWPAPPPTVEEAPMLVLLLLR